MDNQTKKIICIIAFIFILLSLLIIVFTGAANGYEISIYETYPSYFWLFLLISIFCGFIVMVTDSLGANDSKWWTIGFFIVLFSNLIILLLPLFRGYITFGRGDVLSHVGYSIDILNNGHFGSAGTTAENFYPIIHLLMVSLNQITGINLELIAEILPIFFIMFYVVSIYLLSEEITKDKYKSILITAFGSILLFRTENLMLAPSVQTFFLLPFLLLIFYKTYHDNKDSIKYSVLFVLMLVLMPFLHPGEGTLYLIPLFLGINLSLIVYNKFKIKGTKPVKFNKNLLNVVLIIFVTWAAWFMSTSSFGRQAGKITNWLVFQSGSTNAAEVSSLLSQANLSIIQFINLAMNTYGQQLIYILLGALISIIVVIRVLRRKRSVDSNIFTFTILFFIFFGLAIFSFVSYIGVDSFRGIRYLLFVSTILIGIFAYDYIKSLKGNYKKYGTIFVLSVIMLSCIMGVFNTYGSSETNIVNYQVTKMELTGDNWFLDNRDKNLYIESITPSQIKRFSSSILGVKDFYNSTYKFRFKTSLDHFNYTNTSTYGDSLVKDTYFVDWKLNRIYYPSIYPEYENIWRFSSKDFEYLDYKDTSVNSIYSNGEFWIYYIKSI